MKSGIRTYHLEKLEKLEQLAIPSLYIDHRDLSAESVQNLLEAENAWKGRMHADQVREEVRG